MKRILVVVALCLLFLSSNASANEVKTPGNLGLGGKIGYPSLALSMNVFCTEKFSIEADVGPVWSFWGLAGDVNFLFWPHVFLKKKPLDMSWFVGPGVGVQWYYASYYAGPFTSQTRMVLFGDVHASIGLALLFNSVPVDLTIGINPGVGISQFGAFPFVTGGIAARYYF